MKKPSAVVAVLVLLTLLMTGFPRSAGACPVVMPLWFVIDAAEVIVLARVARVESPASEGNDRKVWESQYGYSVAVLEVRETWKGEAARESRVHTFIAPQLSEGQVVIAFLERGESRTQRMREIERREAEENEDAPREKDPARQAIQAEWDREYDAWHQGKWLSIALSEGFMTIDEADAATFRELIERAVKLQAAGAVSDAEMREWSISAAERRATREHGLRLLPSPALPYIPEIDVLDDEADLVMEFEELGPDDAPAPLSNDDLARLAAGFSREPSVDESDLEMLRLLAGYADPEVDRAAAATIEAGLLLRPIPWWVTAMVAEVLKRFGDRLEDRIGRDDRDPRGRPIYTGEGENTLPTIWEVARRELGIPQVPPAVPPVRKADPD